MSNGKWKMTNDYPLPNWFRYWKFNPAAEATVIWLTDLMLANTQQSKVLFDRSLSM